MSILLAFNSCSDDEIENPSPLEENSINGHNQVLNKRNLTFEDFYKLNNTIEVKKIAEKISKINLSSKLNKSENYNISTENIIEIEYFNQKTYTFFVKNDEDGLLNFVIKETPEKTSYYFILYPNGFTPYKKDETNTKVKIKEISQSELAHINFDKSINSKSSSEMYGNVCVQIMACSSGQHNKDNISEWYKCTVSSKPQMIIVDCDNDLPIGGGGGGTGSGGGPIGGDPSNPNPGNGQQPPTGVITDPNTGQDHVKLMRMLNEITVYLQNKITQSQLDFLYANLPILSKFHASILNSEYSQETYLSTMSYLHNNSSAKDYFNLNKQDLDILFALGTDFFNQNPNISWDYLENWFFNGNNLNSTIMNEYLEDLKNPDIVKPTKRFKNNTKINSIYNQAKNAANFKQYLKNFEPTFSVAHLLFDVGETSDGNYAVTSVPKDYWIKITFNQNVDWTNTPKIIIADTFMHEMIHAEIFRKLLSLASTNGNIDVNKITQYLNTHNYPGLFDYYVNRTVGGENWQHETMASHYVNIMVNFLKQLYSNKYTDTEYKTIVWMGLKGTIAWNSLSQTERTLYETTWNEKYWTWEH